MTAAELKTLRESLGLTPQWLADAAHVNLRTIQYWEADPKKIIPDDVAEIINDLDHLIDALVYVDSEQLQNKSSVVLIRFKNEADLYSEHSDFDGYPVTTHAVYLARLRKVLVRRGVKVGIEYSANND